MIEAARRRRLFDQRDRWKRTLPFLVVLGIAFALLPLEADSRHSSEQWVAAALAVVTVAAIALVPWRRLAPDAGLAPLLLFLAVVALLRDGRGGAPAGYAPLVLVPPLWAGVFGRWRDLAVTTAAAGLTVGLPIVIAGNPEYPHSEIRRAVLLTLLAAVAGGGIGTLMRDLSAEIDRRVGAERALERLAADEVHDDIVQALTVVQLALALGDRGAAETAAGHALDTAQGVVGRMLVASGADTRPGTHRRRRPATPPLPYPDPRQ